MTLFRRGLAALAALACLSVAAPAMAQEAIAQAEIPAAPAAPPRVFASLTEALAAQDQTADDEGIRCLASAVYFESRGEPLVGQLAVAQVILNRLRSGRYAGDVCAILRQRGQFGFVRGGVIPAVDATTGAFRTAIAIARVATTRAWVAERAANAMFFNGVRAARVGSVRIATIGNHAFYR